MILWPDQRDRMSRLLSPHPSERISCHCRVKLLFTVSFLVSAARLGFLSRVQDERWILDINGAGNGLGTREPPVPQRSLPQIPYLSSPLPLLVDVGIAKRGKGVQCPRYHTLGGTFESSRRPLLSYTPQVMAPWGGVWGC